MTAGHSQMFAHKTRAIRTAVVQGWSASTGLRKERRAPPQVLNASRDYLLIVTNKELGASRGTTLASMYPPETLVYPDPEARRFLPLSNIYVLSIEDFERLVHGALTTELALPAFMDDCVAADQVAETSVRFFEQHLDRWKLPRAFSTLVENTLDQIAARLGGALEAG
jgi:hypothetical protein